MMQVMPGEGWTSGELAVQLSHLSHTATPF